MNGIWAAIIGASLFIAIIAWDMKHPPKDKRARRLFNSVFNVRVADWRLDIALPAVLAAALAILFYLRGGFVSNPLLATPLGIAYSIGIAPVFEEMFFRGMLVGIPFFWRKPPVAKRLGIPEWLWAALLVAVSSWVFMELHWILALDIFVSALLYGTLYVWRRNLVAPVVAHSMGNFTLLAVAMLLG